MRFRLVENFDLEETVKEFLAKNFETEFSTIVPSSIVFRDGTIISASFHPDMLDALMDNNIISDEDYIMGGTFFTNKLGCLRMTAAPHAENYVSLPPRDKNLTWNQKDKLESWLNFDYDHFPKNIVAVVPSGASSLHSDYKAYQWGEYFPEDVYNRINRYYASGVLYENINEISNEYSNEIDSAGNLLTKDQANYFKNSKIRDKKGHLLLMHHGSRTKGIQEFIIDKEAGNFFSTSKDYANEYTSDLDTDEVGEIYDVYLNITKPFDVLNPDNEVAKTLIRELNLHFTKRTTSDTDIIYKYLVQNPDLGYDGVIAGEELSPSVRKHYGEAANTSYVPLYANCIKSITNKHPTSSGDIYK